MLVKILQSIIFIEPSRRHRGPADYSKVAGCNEHPRQRSRIMGWYKDLWMRIPKPIRWVINRIDNPFDAVLEWAHCHKLPFGGQLNLSFLMKNRETTWDIIRKHGTYSNCDKEDK
jgi:hypothetical protein